MRAFVTLVFYAPSISGNVYLIWTVLFSGDDYGYVNSLLLKLGLIYQPVQWLQNANTVLIIVILVSLWMSLGHRLPVPNRRVPGDRKSYYEAGAVDGIKTGGRELWFITLPMMKPQLMFSAVMSITSSFGVGPVITALCGYPTTDYAAHTVMNHLTDYGTIPF